MASTPSYETFLPWRSLVPRGSLLLALVTDTVNLKGVPRSYVVMLAPDVFLDLLNLGRKEFYRTAALRTHHVMMAAAIVLMLISGDAVVECDLAGESALGQQFERAVHGGKSDARVTTLHQLVQFFGGEMVMRIQKGTQDSIALARMFQPHALEVAVKNLLRLSDRLMRELHLIVNAFRQNGHS